MKKFIFNFVALLFMCISFVSCNKCTDGNSTYVDEIQYNLTAEGQADGNFKVTFPHGEFQSDGIANLLFKVYSNDSIMLRSNESVPLTKALQSSYIKENTAANRVESDLSKIEITSAEGTYYIRLVGYAKEPVTGLVFAIDKTYTNKTPDMK